MNKTITYLFDPLCGWCYGAMPALSLLNDTADICVELLPTGLFAGDGARMMDEAFADYAWRNDQRIQSMTGQRFTDIYRDQVLRKLVRFDSGPATVALTAVSLTEPAQELEALKAIQLARYVDGKDNAQFRIVTEILQSLKLERAADMVANPTEELLRATQSRIHRAQTLMAAMNARGVPTFIISSGEKHRKVDSGNAYTDPGAFIQQIMQG